MSWGKAVKIQEDINNHFRLSIDVLKEEVKTIIDENVYIVGSSNSSDIISETFPCSLKRKGIVIIYCNASSDYTSSERKVYVDIKINDSVVDTLTVTVPKNYLNSSGFKYISVNIGDVIDYNVRTSGIIGYDISLRGKIELKGGIIE